MLDRLGNVGFNSSPPGLVLQLNDEVLGLVGALILDRVIEGRACGGVRLEPAVSLDELADIARAMTYKWAFIGVPMGGAKGNISIDPDQSGHTRAAVMEAYGRCIAPLVQRGIYFPAEDMGTTFQDLGAIMRGAGAPLHGPQIDASRCTALTVVETVRQVVLAEGRGLADLRVALEGFGKVGSVVASLLDRAGARLVAVSTASGVLVAAEGLDVPRLLALRERFGSALVHEYPGAQTAPHAELFSQPVDLLIPGARANVIRDADAGRIQARWIVPIANAPLEPAAERELTRRGVVVVPDFVANCGGILAVSALSSGFRISEVERLIQTSYAELLRTVIATSRRQARPIGEVARALAERNLRAFQTQARPDGGPLERARQVARQEGLRGLSLR